MTFPRLAFGPNTELAKQIHSLQKAKSQNQTKHNLLTFQMPRNILEILPTAITASYKYSPTLTKGISATKLSPEKEAKMGRSTAEERRCKKHPKHKQSTGVCPSCLREKLSRLASSSTFSSLAYGSSSSASSSAYSSDSELSSLAASPPRRHGTKRTRLSLLFKQDVEPLKKSRSLIFVIGRRKEEDGEEGVMEKGKGKKEEKKEKRRFWSKLLNGNRRRREEEGCSLSHSKTLKEKAGPKWVLFS